MGGEHSYQALGFKLGGFTNYPKATRAQKSDCQSPQNLSGGLYFRLMQICNCEYTYSPLADIESLLHRQFASGLLPIVMGGSIMDYPGFFPLRRNSDGRANGAAISFFAVAAGLTVRSGTYTGINTNMPSNITIYFY